MPALVPLTADSTPELWAEQHKAVTDHEAQVSAWGAVCACGAVWTRDPAKGGPARRGEPPLVVDLFAGVSDGKPFDFSVNYREEPYPSHGLLAECCSNVGPPGQFVCCGADAVAWYLHNDDVCSYCALHDVPCGKLLARRVVADATGSTTG